MQPTLIGGIILIIGIVLLLRGSVTDMFWLMLSCTLLGGASALNLPALGGSSIPPVQIAIIFMAARILLPGAGLNAAVSQSVHANAALGVYALYGVAVAMIAPRIFAGDIYIVPLRYQKLRTLLETFPLAFTPQNITAAVYLIGTFLAANVAFIAVSSEEAARKFVKVTSFTAWAHIFFGVSGALFGSGAFGEALKLLRNANYAQLDQSFNGFSRLNGIFPEASAYAAYAFGWFVFHFECWYRDVLPRYTGPAAAGLVAILIFSTSSTAYAGLAIYGTIFAGRSLFLPWAARSRKLIIIAAGVLLLFALASSLVFAAPEHAASFQAMLERATLGKQDTSSGIQRGFWARTGWDAFVKSFGLGIGPGSFRSSSFIMAMIGSVGVIGSALFAAYFTKVWKPLRASSYMPVSDTRLAIGVSASWAALAVMIPAALIASGADPGTDFAIFAGIALSLRRLARSSGHDPVPAAKYEPLSGFPSSVRGRSFPLPAGSASSMNWRRRAYD